MYKKVISLAVAGALMSGCLTAFAEPTHRGDLNGDGAVTITDLSKLAVHVKNIKLLEGDSLVQADVNFDGIVNVTDLSLLAAHVKSVKDLPFDPDRADETFEGYDAFLMFADSDMNWGNWNGQGYLGKPSYGIDADIKYDGVYTVSITRDSITADDDTGANPSLVYTEDWWSGEEYLGSAYGCTIMCVDITGLLDGTLAADGSELEGFLEDGDNANINKRVKGSFRGDEIEVELLGIRADGRKVDFDPSKVRYGNLDEEDNCYRIEIANLLERDVEDAAIDVDYLYFDSSLEITFRIKGIGEDPNAVPEEDDDDWDDDDWGWDDDWAMYD